MADVLVNGRPAAHTSSRLSNIRWRSVLRPVLLLLILVIAALFRFSALDWDQDRHLHPDERYITVLASQLKSPPGLREYFDSGKSTLNPFNTDWGHSYVYGTLPLFAGRYFAEFMDQGCGTTAKLVPHLLDVLIFGPDVQTCRTGTFVGYDYMALLGRIWSGCVDLLSVFILALIGRRLFGWRAGLLAAVFSAVTVLQIQQAHYFTVDSTANLFVVLTIWFCALLITDTGEWSIIRKGRFLAHSLLAGLCTGCAIASKISVWPLVPLIIASIVIMLLRDRRDGLVPLGYASIALLLAGITTFASFRVAQPYAFVGSSVSEFQLTLQRCGVVDAKDMLARVCSLGTNLPQFVREIFAPSARWIEQLNLSLGFVNGTIDAPFGHQWANRTPIVFPLINLVFWGLGLPLGIAACASFLYAARQLLRGRRWWAYFIPVTWAGFYFLYQSTQWTKSMRYVLNVYPMLSLCAAIGLLALWRKVRSNTQPILRVVPGLTISFVVIGSLVWALAFMQIYSGPITRVSASRWVYENIPTAVTLQWTSESGKTPVTNMQLPVKLLGLSHASATILPFRPEIEAVGNDVDMKVVLNHVQGKGIVRTTLLAPDGTTPLATRQQSVDQANSTIDLGHVPALTETTYYVGFQVIGNSDITARTSTVANEHWDDAVPQPVDGKDAYGSYYNGLKSSSDGQIQNYAEDTPDKLPQVLNWLDEADYLVMSSNRLYASIPRLPWRFPMTTEYYRAMLSGELGFELVADFSSFPRLGPFVFNDQEMPQTLQRSPGTQGTAEGINVPYPTAEEAFSVYDHPRVLIFKKSAAYSRALALQILGKYDLTRTIQQTPLQAVNTPRGMLFDDRTRSAQQAGGTWSELFPRDSILNQSQPLAVVALLLLVELLGLACYPIILLSTSHKLPGIGASGVTTLHPTLVDGGYSFAKILGLLLVAIVVWWLSSVKITTFTALQVWCVVITLTLGSLALWWRNRTQLISQVRTKASVLIASEILFLLAFTAFLLIRYGNPDLWHPYMGGEKPMDFAYFNAILKSSYFPPIDPWFSGGYVNYYYFGFVIIGAPIKALGIDPAIAYNILVPLLFALTASGAFGLGISFYSRISARVETTSESILNLKKAILAGFLAAFFVVGIGNLRELDVILPAWQQLGGIKAGVPSVMATLSGIYKWIGGAQLPIYPNWPYWNPTRPTAGLPVDSVQIAEFPLFTFLYADLHAHMMAMPLAYLALAFALSYVAGIRKWYAIVLGAIAVGSLWPTNSWDYPVYLIVGMASLIVARLDQVGKRASFSDVFKQLLITVPVIGVFSLLTRVFFIPYLENYGTAYNSIEPWTSDRTPLSVYTSIYGLFLIIITAYFLIGIWRNTRRQRTRLPFALAGGVLCVLVSVGLFLAGVPVAIIAVPVAAFAFLAAIMPGTASQTRILWLLTAGAAFLTIFVELFTLRGDIGRMNTLFKFYIQAWLILGVSTGVVLVWVYERIAELISDGGRISSVARYAFRPVLTIVVSFNLLLAVMFPVFAVPAKIQDRYVPTSPHTLDGMTYMLEASRSEGNGNRLNTFPLIDDYQAIKWMQDHVVGSPTIIEGTTGPNLYRWGNRFSTYTGLPAVIGWQWHQRQQRAALNDQIVYDRDSDVDTFYSTADIGTALKILRRYNSRYVILGQLERSYYDPVGLPKFNAMVQAGFLKVAYTNTGTTIYEVSASALGAVTNLSRNSLVNVND